MGVTIKSKNHKIVLSYSGFYQIRVKVAELTEPDIYEHYKKLNDWRYVLVSKGENFSAEYDKKIVELDEKYDGKYTQILEFLYTSDSHGEADAEHCKSVYEIIKEYDDDIIYGYRSGIEAVLFKNFKQLIKDGADTGTGIEWY